MISNVQVELLLRGCALGRLVCVRARPSVPAPPLADARSDVGRPVLGQIASRHWYPREGGLVPSGGSAWACTGVGSGAQPLKQI